MAPAHHRKTKSASLSSYLKAFTKLVTFSVNAAASGTVSLVTTAATKATDLAAQPFNSLVKATRKEFFQPKIAYQPSPWAGVVESISSRKRAFTASFVISEVDDSNTGSTRTTLGPARPPPRSMSIPAQLSASIRALPEQRPRPRPMLHPIDTSSANFLHASREHRPRLPSPLSPAFSNYTPFLSPGLSVSSSLSSTDASMPNTPQLYGSSCPASDGAPRTMKARHAQEINLAGRKLAAFRPLGQQSEITKFSFWNLVGLNELEAETGEEGIAVTPEENEPLQDACEILISFHGTASPAKELPKARQPFRAAARRESQFLQRDWVEEQIRSGNT